MREDFINEPYLNMSDPAERQMMQDAIDFVGKNLGKHYDIFVGGKAIPTPGKIISYNPSKKDEVVGSTGKATTEIAELAIQTAHKTYKEYWSKVDPRERARLLYRAAGIMRRRKLELSAWMVYEVGKNWIEAIADTAEAIDFLEYYGRLMEGMAIPYEIPQIPGEENNYWHIPLGVGVVIPPWNFPLAILAGMTTAAVVTGNCVVLKPASPSVVIAAKFMEVMIEAGLPPGVVNFIPGPGGEVGDYIVDHKLTRFISFTGSMAVGKRIYERASKVNEGQLWLKRVVAEMGGKDTQIIDDNYSKPEYVVDQTIAAAFGFQGQKCSACSRLIIVGDQYDKIVEGLVQKANAIKKGDTRDGNNWLGPVSSEQAYKTITEYIEIGKKEGKLVAGGGYDDSVGYYIEPTIIKDVDPMARISQEEIFGPVLAIFKARDFDHALEIANNTIYGLTGAVFSDNNDHLNKARHEFHVGNLYLNRKCTGALVGSQPFGGFNMSGTDSKAGGFDYLNLFMQGKTTSERLDGDLFAQFLGMK
ncbi:MAG TPA: L-glutamate gamma-semialdehyde dehydrogenase [Caldisericia bacterium]|nr:L-glutamate gamma-semialdehyde dehydrogenase [Caldisericia bacterium]HPF49002.1 L-glutamate gamma-semialdehyde dehydrogenase [Caldisericia bacterium]HPI83134.1 L-glutamate gamma-semialdehyde dehydrogenase [Caldisericia bacterium]HPQ92361.1 L-glutamate gamma-semialdehyde dehydrogenase [Caldisericia bacterium]HRV74541.1 L-glutamate gamma-semialdehyde dehydrogenase [Caldisericia bacterium]